MERTHGCSAVTTAVAGEIASSSEVGVGRRIFHHHHHHGAEAGSRRNRRHLGEVTCLRIRRVREVHLLRAGSRVVDREVGLHHIGQAGGRIDQSRAGAVGHIDRIRLRREGDRSLLFLPADRIDRNHRLRAEGEENRHLQLLNFSIDREHDTSEPPRGGGDCSRLGGPK